MPEMKLELRFRVWRERKLVTWSGMGPQRPREVREREVRLENLERVVKRASMEKLSERRLPGPEMESSVTRLPEQVISRERELGRAQRFVDERHPLMEGGYSRVRRRWKRLATCEPDRF